MKRSTVATKTVLAKAVTRANLQEQRASTLTTEAMHLQLSLDAALAKIRELMTELAEVKAHYRLAEAELVRVRAELNAHIGDTDITTPEEEIRMAKEGKAP